jgi:SAM-dependent methyltransferase
MKAVRARRAAALVGVPLWLSLRRTRPVSGDWGFDRGTPVDRFYLEEFLQAHRDAVRGDVLELKSSGYTERLGGSRVGKAHVLDIDPSNAAATVVADLDEPGSLPVEAYDCFLFMQTLQFLPHPEVALANAWSALRPGGTLLLTVPAVSKVERELPDFWRFTPAGLRELLGRVCPSDRTEVRGYGNVLTACAFLLGLAAEELRKRDLDVNDPDFPILACARVEKAAYDHRTHSPPRLAS